MSLIVAVRAVLVGLYLFFVFVACLFAIARRKTCFFKVGFIANEGVLSVPDALL